MKAIPVLGDVCVCLVDDERVLPQQFNLYSIHLCFGHSNHFPATFFYSEPTDPVMFVFPFFIFLSVNLTLHHLKAFFYFCQGVHAQLEIALI